MLRRTAILAAALIWNVAGHAAAQYEVVTIGDSWAGYIANGAPGSVADSGTGNALQNVFDFFGTGGTGGGAATVYNGSFYGGTAAGHAADLATITANINAAGPDADFVYLSTGGNDFLAGELLGGWYWGMPNEQAFFDTVGGHVQTVVDHILSIRPEIQIVIGGYDYPNVWDPELSGDPGSAGNILRDNYRLGAQGTPFGLLDGAPTLPAIDIAGQAAFNAAIRSLDQRKQDIAAASRRVHYVENFGLVNALDGYDGYFNGAAAADLPVDQDRLAGGGSDPIHLDTTGYEILGTNSYNVFFHSAFMEPQLSVDAAIDFGAVRVGDTANATATASNAGPFFTKLEGVTFGMAAGAFSGGGTAVAPLFRDPTLGSDTAEAGYSFAPAARGADSTSVLVDTDGGSASLQLLGSGVGPQFDAVASLDFGEVAVGAESAIELEIANLSTDDDGGESMLTDLTLLSAVITGADAAFFDFAGFTVGIVVSQGDLATLDVEFSSVGAPGPRSAVLEITTDEGSAFGNTGLTFWIDLWAEVPALSGDVNSDGVVNGLDANVVSANFGLSGATLGQGDANGDGLVNGLDANVVSTNWMAGVSSTSIPEPDGGLLAIVGIVIAATRRLPTGRRMRWRRFE